MQFAVDYPIDLQKAFSDQRINKDTLYNNLLEFYQKDLPQIMQELKEAIDKKDR